MSRSIATISNYWINHKGELIVCKELLYSLNINPVSVGGAIMPPPLQNLLLFFRDCILSELGIPKNPYFDPLHVSVSSFYRILHFSIPTDTGLTNECNATDTGLTNECNNISGYRLALQPNRFYCNSCHCVYNNMFSGYSILSMSYFILL